LGAILKTLVGLITAAVALPMVIWVTALVLAIVVPVVTFAVGLVTLGIVLAVLFAPVWWVVARERRKRELERWKKELERWR
jgi:ABC-type transport system involved in cytochrome c biogenesis permease subunit